MSCLFFFFCSPCSAFWEREAYHTCLWTDCSNFNWFWISQEVLKKASSPDWFLVNCAGSSGCRALLQSLAVLCHTSRVKGSLRLNLARLPGMCRPNRVYASCYTNSWAFSCFKGKCKNIYSLVFPPSLLPFFVPSLFLSLSLFFSCFFLCFSVFPSFFINKPWGWGWGEMYYFSLLLKKTQNGDLMLRHFD